MYTPWSVIVQELVASGSSRTPDVVRFAYAHKASGGVLFQSLAQVLMSFDPKQGLLTQGYALAWYLKEREWPALTGCAHDSLMFPSLRMTALAALLTAAIHLDDTAALVASGERACRYHRDGGLSQPQLIALFFQAILPYYPKKQRGKEILLLRQVLHAYRPDFNHLLYTYLQTNLHAYTTDIAQELIGQPDIFPRS